MPFSIKDNEADRLARTLVKETGENLTQAVRTALRERLERVRRDRGGDLAQRVAKVVRAYRRLQLRDRRPADQILGYDDRGLLH